MSEFAASFEISGGFVRVYAPGAPPPAPFLFGLGVVADGGIAIIKALSTTDLTPAQCAAVRECLRASRRTIRPSTRPDPRAGILPAPTLRTSWT
jgi:hypothetical protein